MTDTLLVTGASGQLGRLVLDALLASGKVAPAGIVATTRDTAKLADYAARGVTVRAADFDDPASLDAAFAGATKVLIVSTDALDQPGKRLTQHTAAVAAARKAGVKHILYTSMPQPDDSLVTFAPDHLGTEDAIKATGIPYTILRDGWYAENLFMSLPHALEAGAWYTSTGEGRIAHITRADTAAALAGALLKAGDESRTYTLTGTKSRTAEEIAAVVSAATGKPLKVVHVTDAQLAEGLKAAGLPEGFIPTIVSFDANTREGKIAAVTGDAEALSGSKPTSFEDFVAASKAAFLG
ncbi:SDR family oxidoreductase [Shinella zoogloeoides]|uniref:NAD(P)H-binding protein n=1 Tax=Shinella zoogloeoides TaxID=352475 RepID=A0A6N8TB88_SHIZO|nr:SDR family oxidoreductase [Shinella zoogloeoides]MXO00552.1 NAD(P)H-binding protein [Shinella zoogloeoides]UEX79982.1 SDR family oxidoreductase [Shinella zoogloeoides]